MASTNPLIAEANRRMSDPGARWGTRINTRVTGGKNEYDVYRTKRGNYYFMYQGKPVMIDNKYNDYLGNNYKSVINIKQQPKARTSNVPAYDEVMSSSSFSGGGGGGGGAAAMAAPAIEDWQNLTDDQIAGKLGLKGYKYDDILGRLDAAAAAKFNEIDTTLKRTQAQNLRGLEENYANYVNTLRADKANAISSGITKGQAAAMQILSGITGNKAISDSQQKINDELFKATQERGTMLAENKNLAQTQADAWSQYLGTLRSQFQANEVNQYAADAAAMAQKYSADASTRAAGITAGATRYAANAPTNDLIEQLRMFEKYPGLKQTYLDTLGSVSAFNQ
jgi:hypothetical protein